MPDLISIAQQVGEQPAVAVLDGQRCLPARDGHTTCSTCAQACPVSAITVVAETLDPADPHGPVTRTEPGGPRINDEACTRCGRCITACPVGALIALPPYNDQALLEGVASASSLAAAAAGSGSGSNSDSDSSSDSAAATTPSATEPSTPPLCITCERMATTTRLSADRVLVLPCLGWIDPSLLFHGACSGALDIRLIAPCSTCPQTEATTHLADCIATAQKLCALAKLDAQFCLAEPTPSAVDGSSTFKEPAASKKPAALGESFFLEESLILEEPVTPEKPLAPKEPAAPKEPSPTKELSPGEDPLVPFLAAPHQQAVGEVSRRSLFSQTGTSLLKTATREATKHVRTLTGAHDHDAPDAFTPEPEVRRWQLLDDLHAAGVPADSALVPRELAPLVSITYDRCSGCAQCASFCPTAALQKAGKLSGGKTLLEFDPTRCCDCGVCQETCRYGALTCEEGLTTAQLFDLDPLAITIPPRRVLPSSR